MFHINRSGGSRLDHDAIGGKIRSKGKSRDLSLLVSSEETGSSPLLSPEQISSQGEASEERNGGRLLPL